MLTKLTTKLPIIPAAIILKLISQKIIIAKIVIIREIIKTSNLVGKDLGIIPFKTSVITETNAANIPMTPITETVEVPNKLKILLSLLLYYCAAIKTAHNYFLTISTCTLSIVLPKIPAYPSEVLL